MGQGGTLSNYSEKLSRIIGDTFTKHTLEPDTEVQSTQWCRTFVRTDTGTPVWTVECTY